MKSNQTKTTTRSTSTTRSSNRPNPMIPRAGIGNTRRSYGCGGKVKK